MKKGLLIIVAFLMGFAVKGVAQTDGENILCAPTVVSPADGETVNKLETVTLTFPYEVNVNSSAKCSVYSAEEGASAEAIAYARLSLSPDGDYTKVILALHNTVIETLGSYKVVIPAESVWAADDETKKSAELSYTYKVDPDYWNPDWVIEVGANCTQESPCQLSAGFKYGFTEMYSYMQFTASENGRLCFTFVDGKNDYDLWSADSEWGRIGELSKTSDGISWIGVEAGKTYNITNYSFYQRVLKVTFEAGETFEALQSIGTFPVAGGQYSTSIEAPKSYENGAVEFYFSTKVNKDEVKVYVVLPTKNNKEIEVTEDVTLYDGAIEYGKTPAYLAVMISDVIGDIKSENGLEAGDAIQVVLKNVQDVNNAANTLAEPLVLNLTLAATVCTSVYPDPEYSVSSMPTELSLRFDGDVVCTNGKGRIIDVKSGDVQEFTIDKFECIFKELWSSYYEATIELPALEKKLTGKQFRIEIEGLADREGHVISYGDEVGKFVLDYRFDDAAFNYVSATPADGSELTSIKTTKLTFGDEVHIGPDASAYFYYGDDEEVTGTFAVDPADPKSVIITWAKEVSQPGKYGINIEEGSIYDGGYDATKEDLGLADGAYYNPSIYLEYMILADLSSTKVSSITPEPYSFMADEMEKLPAEAVIEFEGGVKEITSVYGQASVGGGWAADATLPEGATALVHKLEGNKLTVTLPAEEVAAITYGSYTITVNAVGEDGKPIGYALDSWGDLDMFGEYISFSYQVVQVLKLTETVPSNFSTVKELSTVTLTFSEDLVGYDRYSDTPCLLNAEDDSKVADLTYTISGNQLVLALAEPLTAKGSYAAYVPSYAIESESGIYNDNDIYVFIDVDPDYVAEEVLAITATPENGATVESLTTVELKLNKEVGYLYHSMLIPSDGGDDAASASLERSETDATSYTLDFTFGGFLKDGATLRKGVTYTMTFEAWPSEEAYQQNQGTPETVTLTYVGNSEGFQYSGLKLESITPTEDFVISDKSQNKFVVKFSGPVELVESLTYVNMGQGATQKFESVIANDGQTEYTLTIAESVLASIRGTVNIVFAANDLDGKRLQGNNGEGEYSTFAYYYTTVIGVSDLTVTPDASVEQASLSVISVKCADGLVPSWTAGNITLTDANGNSIALNDPEAVVAEGASEWATPTEWAIALKEEVKSVGTYTLTIPAGYFNIGSTQGQVVGSKETVVVFNITEKAIEGIKGVRIAADTEVVAYDVTGVLVARGKASDVLANLSKGLYIVNGQKVIVK